MKSYTREEVFNKTLEYFKGDELATNVWINKYCLKDSLGNLFETNPDDMHKRLAKELHRIESKYENPLSEELIYQLLKEFKYIVPAGGSMSGVGNNNQYTSLSNCFVIGNQADSYGGLLMTDQEQVQLMKRRGGVGHDLSHIRPKGTPVKNSALTSTGVVPFMERYSNSTREVAQDGRRGALMLSIHIKHMDAEDFINAKLDTNKITGANISVKIDNEFMNAVINGTTYTQQYPIDSDNPIYTKEVDARKIWNKLIENNWKSAEPGILFWDKLVNYSPSDSYPQYKTTSTNPCVIGDTLVLTNLGWIKIKNLLETFKKINYKIITRDKEGKLYNSDLQDVLLTEEQAELYKIEFSNGEFMLINSKHKFYNENFEEVVIDNIIGKFIISGEGLVEVLNCIETDMKEDVYDLTASPNYNFFSILNKEEFIVDEDIIINDNIRFKYFDIVNTDKGQLFAYELTEKHELI